MIQFLRVNLQPSGSGDQEQYFDLAKATWVKIVEGSGGVFRISAFSAANNSTYTSYNSWATVDEAREALFPEPIQVVVPPVFI